MKKTIDVYDFRNEFEAMNRGDNFSYEGLKKLFNYLDDYYDDMELDVIVLCCEYTEYDSFEDIQNDYNVETIEELEEKTTVIKVDYDRYIIQAY